LKGLGPKFFFLYQEPCTSTTHVFNEDVQGSTTTPYLTTNCSNLHTQTLLIYHHPIQLLCK